MKRLDSESHTALLQLRTRLGNAPTTVFAFDPGVAAWFPIKELLSTGMLEEAATGRYRLTELGRGYKDLGPTKRRPTEASSFVLDMAATAANDAEAHARFAGRKEQTIREVGNKAYQRVLQEFSKLEMNDEQINRYFAAFARALGPWREVEAMPEEEKRERGRNAHRLAVADLRREAGISERRLTLDTARKLRRYHEDTHAGSEAIVQSFREHLLDLILDAVIPDDGSEPTAVGMARALRHVRTKIVNGQKPKFKQAVEMQFDHVLAETRGEARLGGRDFDQWARLNRGPEYVHNGSVWVRNCVLVLGSRTLLDRLRDPASSRS